MINGRRVRTASSPARRKNGTAVGAANVKRPASSPAKAEALLKVINSPTQCMQCVHLVTVKPMGYKSGRGCG